MIRISDIFFQIVHILSVPTNQLLSYSSLKEDETIHDLKLRVKGETTIPVELQELISSRGEELGESELIKDVTGEHVRMLPLFIHEPELMKDKGTVHIRHSINYNC